MPDLFDQNYQHNIQSQAPLADRIRPKSLDQFFGQEEIVGRGTLLRQAIEKDDLHSMIFWGPPGSGKTTLAVIIAQMTNSNFVQISAVTSGVKDLRRIIKDAHDKRKYKNQKTILFIDEIHRWNKSQQDGLLPYVEKGIITLIGVTTENPSFEVISPLLSRLRVYVLKPLSNDNLKKIIERALQDREVGLGKYNLKIDNDAEEFLIRSSGGDARIILNALELAFKYTDVKSYMDQVPLRDKHRSQVTQDVDNSDVPRFITKSLIEQALQHKALKYDKGGDEHYNVVSAFIKSLRGSDVDAGLYWLARMLEAGEDPKFIARRMIILASEDIGNADPLALVIANAVFSAVEKIGLPECQLNLAQGVVYLAKAPKSNKSYLGLLAAKKAVKEIGALPVPLHLRNAPTKLMKDLGYGKDYKYSHDFTAEEGRQDYLPEGVVNRKYYE